VTIGNLRHLNVLKLGGNRLSSLPPFAAQLVGPSTLNLKPETLDPKPVAASSPKPETRNLKPETRNQDQLKELSVEGNLLQTLFIGIDKCRKLAKLVLSDNLMPVPYTLHPTPCTLNPTLSTLHPKPYTQSSSRQHP